jgi:tetratricopeptide (TPR) repeat protein
MIVKTKLVVVLVLAALLLLPGMPLAKGDPKGEEQLKAAEKFFQDFKFTEADAKLKEAMKSFEAAGDKAGMARTAELSGKYSRELGNYTGAIEAYQGALKIYRESRQTAAEARVLGGIGLTYEDWGDFPGAIYYNKQALRGGLDPQERIKVEMSLGDIYLRLGDEDEAARHLRAAMQAAQGAKSDKDSGAVFIAIGEAFQRAGRLTEASSAYQGVSQGGGEKEVKRQALYHLGDIAVAQKNPAEAANYYRQAQYSIGLGRLALTEQKYDAALQEFGKAVTEAERQKLPAMVFAAQTGLGLSYLGKSQYSQAEDHLKKAVKALEEVRELLPEGKRTFFLSGSTHGFQHLATYEALAITLAMEGKKDEAFKTAEYTRSRALTEALSSKEAVAQETAPAAPQPAKADAKAAAEPPSPSQAIEIMPFSKLDVFMRAQGSYEHAATCSLFIKAVLQDFEGEKQAEARRKAGEIYTKAGYPSAGAENARRKVETLKQQGLKNHLTSLVEVPGKKP